jgi:hypothetical protein
VDNARRSFLRNFLRDAASGAIRGFAEGVAEVRAREDFDAFFDSYESSYALTLNYPDEILIESARMAGIPVEGRDKIAIARDLFEKTNRGAL